MTGKQALKAIYIVLGVALAYIIVNICMDVFQKKPASLFGYSVSYVPTKSMENYIMADSYVLIEETDEVGVNDVIVYKSQSGDTKGLYILHRIVGTKDGGFICKGDNRIDNDPEIITNDMIYGKYVKTLPVLTSILSGNNKSWMFAIIIVVFVLMFIVQAINIFLTYQKEKNNEEKKKEIDELKKQIYKEELLKQLKEEQNK